MSTPRPRLSACLIVRDEAANLPRCLASLVGIVDEIVVVDTGSSDDTVAIAEAAGAVVGTFAWNDDFAAARNAALALATGDWILIIDADEELRVEDAVALAARLDGDPAAYLVPLVDVVRGRLPGQMGQVLRLFPRHAALTFVGRIHESIGQGLATLNLPVYEAPWLTLIHHGYVPAAMPRKAARNMALAQRETAEAPDSALAWFQLARSAVSADRLDLALPAWDRLRVLAGRSDDRFVLDYLNMVTTLCTDHARAQLEACAQLALPRLSVCMIVKNEASQLPRCLASLRGIVDELCIVDTGSTDETEALARAAGAKLGHFTWCDDFSAARNVSLELASGDWILVLDADEELQIDDVQAFRRKLAEPTAASFLLEVQNLSAEGQIESRMTTAPRLFRRNPALQFEGRLHEDLSPALRAQGIASVILPGVAIRHHGYTPAMLADRDKVGRNRRIAEAVAQDQPEDASSWQALASICWLARDVGATLAAVARALELAGQGKFIPTHRLTSLWLIEAAARESLGERERAMIALDTGLKVQPGHPELSYERGIRRVDAGEIAGAIADFQACLAAVGRHVEGTIRVGVTGFLAHAELAVLYTRADNLPAAIQHFEAAQADPACPPARGAELGVMAKRLRLMHAQASQAGRPADATAAAPVVEAVSPEKAKRQELLARLAQDPRDPALFLELGLRLFQDAELDKALLALDQSISLDANVPAAFHLLGLLLARLGQPNLAEKSFATVLQLEPGHRTAIEARLFVRGKPPEFDPPEALKTRLVELYQKVRPTVSACLIVKNEAANLPTCLASLEGFVDEIIVVDTGSTDDTVAIAEAAGARVAHFAWCDDFSAARNASIELATGDWILAIDADETLVIDDLEAFYCSLRRRVAAGYMLDQVNVDATGRADLVAPVLRLFQRHEALRFAGRVHETIEASAEALGWPFERIDALKLRHTGYIPAVVGERDKPGRNAHLASLAAQDAPDSPRAWLALASALLEAGDYAGAGAAFEALERQAGGLAALSGPIREHGVLQRVALGKILGDVAGVERQLDEAIARLPGYPEFHFERGCLRAARGERTGALVDFHACLAQDPAAWTHLPLRPDITGALPRNAVRELEAAGGPVVKAPLGSHKLGILGRLEQDPRDASAFLELAFAFFKDEELDKALLAVGQAIGLDASLPAAYHLLGAVLNKLGQPRWAEKAFAIVLQLDPGHRNALEARLFVRGKTPECEAPEGLPALLEGLFAKVRPTLSACLIVKNEAVNLPRCLASLEGFVDEIIVIDTGSTDDTVAIAEGAGARVEHFTWCDDFGAARNASLALATSDWILVIDADETLKVEDHEAFLKGLRDRRPSAYVLSLDDQLDHGESLVSPVCRLFQRNIGLSYVGRIHESLGASLAEIGWPVVTLAAARLGHTGNQHAEVAAHDKLERNMRLARLAVGERRRDMRAWFALATTLERAGRQEEAEQVLREADGQGLFASLDPGLFAQYVVVRAGLLLALGDDAKAIALLDRALARLPGFPELHFMRGQALAERGERAAAIADFEACLAAEGREWPTMVVRDGITDAFPRRELAKLGVEGKPGPTNERERLLRRLEQDPRDPGAFLELALSCFHERELDKALMAVSQALQLDAAVPASYHLLGAILNQLGQPRWAEKAFATVLQLQPGHQNALEARMHMRQLKAEYEISAELEAQLEALIRLARPTISACLIVKDEASNLPRCLASLVGHVDEIIVIDTGSVDHTDEIARAAGARVEYFPWQDDFSEARNFSLSLATGDWCLVIDADEELVIDDLELFQRTLRRRVAAGYVMTLSNVTPEGLVESTSPVLRLVQRNESLRFRGRLHESFNAGVKALGWPLENIDSAAFHHHGYAADQVTGRDKARRNLRLAKVDLSERPLEADAWLNLARSHSLAGDVAAAIETFECLVSQEEALANLPEPLFALYVITHQDVLRAADRHAEGLKVLDLGLERLPGYADFLFERGNIRYRLGDVEGAKSDFEQCMRTGQSRYTIHFRPGVTDELPKAALEQIALAQAARPLLTACLIVRDEAENLPRCLASLRGVVDEVVVVDTGSTDETVAIASAAGAKIGHFTWCDDFGLARNASLELATGEWILVVDADEELVVEDLQAFRAALGRAEAGGYIFPIHNYADDGHYQISPMLRLFRNHPQVRFAGRLHEEVTRTIEEQGWQVGLLEDVFFRHYGYLREAINGRNKWGRNLLIAIAEVEARPESPLAWYNMARSSLFTGQRDPARAAFAQVKTLLAEGKILGEAPFCNYVVLTARLLMDQGQHAEAEEAFTDALKGVQGFPEFHYERGLLRARRGDHAGARADFEACMAVALRPYTAAMRQGIRDELPSKELLKLDTAAAT